MKLTIDDIMICLALLLGFSTSLLLEIANQSWGTHFPSSLIAFFASISVAALIYRFLGGSGEAQFKMGMLQVTGSAAILFGATWLLGDRINAQSALFSTDAQYRPALESRQKEIAQLRATAADLSDERDDLKGRLTELKAGKMSYSLEQVRRMRPDDPFVSGIRRMMANEDPPFRQILRELPALVTINDAMADTNVYRICVDTQTRLFSGLETENYRLRIRRSYGDDMHVVDVTRGGTITPDDHVCSTTGRTFDIQITCADAVKIFPEKIARCGGLKPVYQAGITTIRGEKVMLGALPPR